MKQIIALLIAAAIAGCTTVPDSFWRTPNVGMTKAQVEQTYFRGGNYPTIAHTPEGRVECWNYPHKQRYICFDSNDIVILVIE